jgi:hypothetical protein
MTTPQNSLIGDLLAEIRDLFAVMRTLMGRLLDNFSPEALEETLRERSRMLLCIDERKTELCAIAGRSAWDGYRQYREIQEHIGALKGLDREVMMEATRRMYAIRRELAALSDASHAASTYTRYCRR